jgi:tRNA dimethylallyltransferase
MSPAKRSSVLFLFGPTGVGKTQILSRCFSTGYEVISADSMQVYRHMDIGTAKPSAQMLKTVPHHLIDTHHPSQQCSVGDFVDRAMELIPQIESRGNRAVVSGGTAFYFKHLLFGLPEAPPSDEKIRKSLEAQAENIGLEAMYDQLREVDPLGAQRIHRTDSHRIIRALEVWYAHGNPLSSYNRGSHGLRERSDVGIIGLFRDTEELYARIGERVDLMFTEGLVGEIRSLLAMGAKEDWPGMRGIGYREFMIARQSGELSKRGIRDEIARNTTRYAKRQMTFFRSLPDVHWIQADDQQAVLTAVHRFFDEPV